MEIVRKTKKGIFVRAHKGFGLLAFSPFTGLFFSIAEDYSEDVLSYCNNHPVARTPQNAAIFDNLGIRIDALPNENFQITNWLPQKEYFSFAEGLPDKPIVINWLISNKCNSNCKYCYASDVIDKPFDKNETKEIAESILSYNPLAVVLSGGEPLMEKKILIDAIRLLGCKTGLIIDTNGLIYDKELVRLFKKNNVVVRISLDSLHGETNNKTRPQRSQRKDTLNTIIENIIQYKAHDIPVLIQTVITSVNKNTIDDMFNKLPALKINGWRVFSVTTPNEEKTPGTFKEVMLFGRTKKTEEAQKDIQDKLKLFSKTHLSKSNFTLEVIFKADSIKNTVILVLPSGKFVTEGVFNNCKIDIDKEHSYKPVNIFKTVDLRGHYERYLGKI
jgi:MoaA/NifB/PqqE/SkfB family radical SAM enzyme